jgi:PAS domain S-box-containing protein
VRASQPATATPPGTRDELLGATGAWVWDFATERVRGDARFASLHGFDPCAAAEGVSAETFFQRIHPDDRLRLRIAVAGVAHGAELFARDYRLTTAEGLRWLSARGRAEHPQDGGPPFFSGVAVDITEQKRVEERLRIAQSAGGVGTFEHVDGFGTATVSDQFCRLLGLHVADALPVRTINAVVDPDHPPLIRPAGPEDAAGGVVQTEHLIRRADTGEARWLSLRGERRRDTEHSGERFIGAIYDVTEAKRSEAKLKELARTLESRVAERTQERDRLWANSRDLFAVLTPKGIYRSVNPAWREILGYADDDLVGRSFREALHRDDLAAAAKVWRTGDDGAALSDFDARMVSKDGTPRWISWTVIPFEDSYYAIGRDVTERKQLEEQLRQSQKMEAVGQLTGGIAHDFNNMLTGVLGGLDMLRRRLDAGRTEDLSRFVEVATTSAERAAALTHRLLAFSRRQTLDPQAIDVNRLVASMEDMLRRTIGVHVDLAVSLASDVRRALCDSNQLESAILNLAINARDAMADGGKLTIETGNAHLEESYARGVEGLAAGEYVLISVSDTGQGMPPEVLARAFDPFFTTKPLGQGTGLGLSMVYGFVRQSGGHISIYSEPSIGTTVKIYLPCAGAAAGDAPQRAAAEPPPGAGEAVLVVEDDPSVRAIIVELLRELGYRVIAPRDTDEALRIIASGQTLDLLVTDVGLPGLNGRQLAEIARQSRPVLPVLFITGYAAGAARRSDMLGPGMDMISKPFAVEALAEKVRDMISR